MNTQLGGQRCFDWWIEKKQAIAVEVIGVLDAYTQNNRAAMAVIAS